jgi:acyl-CoA thioester hydrolase
VLGQLMTVLGAHHVSIAQVVQDARGAGAPVAVVVLTHEAREGDVRAALAAIDRLPVVRAATRVIRITARGQGPLMKHEVRVIFGDTDQMGVVYYANYLRYFEGARAAYWRSFGRTHADLEAWGVALPVIEAHCVYKRPARYEDLLVIEVEVSELRHASCRFVYRVLRGDELLAEGYTRHAVVGPDGRPRAVPQALRDVIGTRSA